MHPIVYLTALSALTLLILWNVFQSNFFVLRFRFFGLKVTDTATKAGADWQKQQADPKACGRCGDE